MVKHGKRSQMILTVSYIFLLPGTLMQQVVPLNKDLQHNYIVKCNQCSNLQGFTSKHDTYDKARKPGCNVCKSKDWGFVEKGQFGLDIKTMERIIIKDPY